MDVKVRQATADDARAIAEAHVRAWQVAYRGMIPATHLDELDVDERTAQWRQNLTDSAPPNGTPSPTNLVAEVGGHVVGFACVGVWRHERDNDELGELWAMYVHPDHWGTGAGYALMGATFDLFRSGSIQTAYLWVLEENELARRFYERQGWGCNDITQQDPIGDTEVTERRYSILL